jgi:hypothetical protein
MSTLVLKKILTTKEHKVWHKGTRRKFRLFIIPYCNKLKDTRHVGNY